MGNGDININDVAREVEGASFMSGIMGGLLTTAIMYGLYKICMSPEMAAQRAKERAESKGGRD